MKLKEEKNKKRKRDEMIWNFFAIDCTPWYSKMEGIPAFSE